MTLRLSRICLSLLFTVATLAAVESEATNHLRLEVQTLPKQIETTISGGGYSADGTIEADTANRFGIGYWYGHPHEVSFLIGGGLDFSKMEFSSNSSTATVDEYGVFIEPGVGIPLNDWLVMEGGARFGFGGVKTSISNSSEHLDDTSYGEASLRARLVARFNPRFEAFIGGGWLIQRFTYVFHVGGTEVTERLTPSGGFIGAGLGWNF